MDAPLPKRNPFLTVSQDEWSIGWWMSQLKWIASVCSRSRSYGPLSVGTEAHPRPQKCGANFPLLSPHRSAPCEWPRIFSHFLLRNNPIDQLFSPWPSTQTEANHIFEPPALSAADLPSNIADTPHTKPGLSHLPLTPFTSPRNLQVSNPSLS